MTIRGIRLHTVASLALAASLWTGAAPSASAQAQQAVSIDGVRVSTATVNVGGSVFVPAVFLRKTGASVQWNAADQAVVMTKGTAALRLKAGERGVFHRPEGTYVPLRNAAQTLGMSVTYNAATATISIASGGGSGAAAARAVQQGDAYWLAQLTEAEAGGEPYEGKVAVAASVLNRVDDPNWPNSIQDVIFHVVEVDGVKYYQYSPVSDGRLYAVTPSEETLKAVQAALDGSDPTNGATVFYNPKKTDNEWVRNRPVSKTIGGHVFAY